MGQGMSCCTGVERFGWEDHTPDGMLQLTIDHLDEAVDILTQAMNGTIHTAPEHIMDWKFGPSNDNISDASRIEAVKWHMSWLFQAGIRYGLCFGLPVSNLPNLELNDEFKKTKSRRFAAVAIIFPPGSLESGGTDPSPYLSLRMLLSHLSGPIRYPPPTHNSRIFPEWRTRERLVARAQRELHMYANHEMSFMGNARDRKVDDNSPAHFLLHTIAVAPEYQSQGVGSAFLTELHQLADITNLPMYVEASGDAARNFFDFNGYTEGSEIEVVHEGMENFVIAGMIRPTSMRASNYYGETKGHGAGRPSRVIRHSQMSATSDIRSEAARSRGNRSKTGGTKRTTVQSGTNNRPSRADPSPQVATQQVKSLSESSEIISPHQHTASPVETPHFQPYSPVSATGVKNPSSAVNALRNEDDKANIMMEEE